MVARDCRDNGKARVPLTNLVASCTDCAGADGIRGIAEGGCEHHGGISSASFPDEVMLCYELIHRYDTITHPYYMKRSRKVEGLSMSSRLLDGQLPLDTPHNHERVALTENILTHRVLV